MKKIILASSSKRRIEMMKNKGYDPVIMPADVDENLPFDMSPEASVMYLALKKASFIDTLIKKKLFKITGTDNSVCQNNLEYPHSEPIADSDNYIILAADTIVVYKNRIIGKPFDKKNAFEILGSLRNNCHRVLTGVCVLDSSQDVKTCLCDNTAVYFKDYSDEELTAYVNTPEPYDKAGGYAIQETFKKYIDYIEGDFDNVVGFPWYRIEPLLN